MTLIHSDQFDVFDTEPTDEELAAAGFHVIISDEELATLDSSVDDIDPDDYAFFLEASYVDPYELLDTYED